jgi:hypothetical protein
MVVDSDDKPRSTDLVEGSQTTNATTLDEENLRTRSGKCRDSRGIAFHVDALEVVKVVGVPPSADGSCGLSA